MKLNLPELVIETLDSLSLPLTDTTKGATIVYFQIWASLGEGWRKRYARELNTQLQSRVSAASRQTNTIEAFTARISNSIELSLTADYVKAWSAALAYAEFASILSELRQNTTYVNCLSQFVIPAFYEVIKAKSA